VPVQPGNSGGALVDGGRDGDRDGRAPHSTMRDPNAAGETGGRVAPARRDGCKLFSCIHFAMDDWGKWRLNVSAA